MIKRKKYIGTFLMWFAGLIVLAHNVVPHHHHFEVDLSGDVTTQACCHEHQEDDCESHEHHADFQNHVCTETHQHNDLQTCHFNVETTTPFSKISLDLLANTSQKDQFFYFPTEEQKLAETQTPQYSSVIHELNPLRGPPSIG